MDKYILDYEEYITNHKDPSMSYYQYLKGLSKLVLDYSDYIYNELGDEPIYLAALRAKTRDRRNDLINILCDEI